MKFPFGRDRDVETETVQQAEETSNSAASQAKTIIASGVTVSGTLEGDGIIQVDGVVKGQIILDGKVIVTATGSIEGPITADLIQVAGSVRGNCVARERMHLERTGSLEGDVTTTSLIVESGGQLNGRSNMALEIAAGAAAALTAPAEELQFGPNYKMEEETEH